MAARIVSTLIFCILMTVLITGAAVLVVTLYVPFVALKAIYYTVTGRLNEVTGLGDQGPPAEHDPADMARPHIG
jgi:hypothetical protein